VLSHTHREGIKVGVERTIAAGMLNDDVLPIVTYLAFHPHYPSRHRCPDRGSHRIGNVNAVVESPQASEGVIPVAEGGGQTALDRVDEEVPKCERKINLIHPGVGYEEFLPHHQGGGTE